MGPSPTRLRNPYLAYPLDSTLSQSGYCLVNTAQCILHPMAQAPLPQARHGASTPYILSGTQLHLSLDRCYCQGLPYQQQPPSSAGEGD
ncbi:hypothetical protein DSO57_1008231 [Entomophthora muscae]|uniref:Uncharacterized protein n=1 Tax=Entomophthora muscae TaxID=34485 RepID=A0ACC2SW26_9FUNG|nr:hypothetical protein DSO57_1008231 [Entomophthora muscae]